MLAETMHAASYYLPGFVDNTCCLQSQAQLQIRGPKICHRLPCIPTRSIMNLCAAVERGVDVGLSISIDGRSLKWRAGHV